MKKLLIIFIKFPKKNLKKIVLKLKLFYTINQVIKNIGKCDSDFFSRNTAAGVKNFVGKTITFAQETISGTNKNTIDTKQAYDDLTNEDKFNATKTNLVRSQLFSFVEMYKANIVSYKEAEIKKKQNSPSWLTNTCVLYCSLLKELE